MFFLRGNLGMGKSLCNSYISVTIIIMIGIVIKMSHKVEEEEEHKLK